MAVESWLRERCRDLKVEGHRHSMASEDVPRNPDWSEWFSFGFVRNPWDRLVSWWHMIQENPRAYPDLPFWRYVRTSGPTFEQFIENCTEAIEDQNTTKSAVRPQLHYLQDAASQDLVRFIGRFETLQLDMDYVADQTGLARGTLVVTNRTKTPKDYRTFYNDHTQQLVAQRFAVDIERFGYSFDRPHQT